MKKLKHLLSKKLSQKTKYFFTGMLLFITIFLVFGTITDLIPNPWFIRMFTANIFDYIFLFSSSILLSSYLTFHFYQKINSKKCDVAVYGGGIGSIFAFSCPLCNKLLILLLGITFLSVYFEPYRILLGFFSLILLSIGLYFKLKQTGMIGNGKRN